MDRLDSIRLFIAAIDGGSLAAAARRHGRSPVAVTRAVSALEQEAGEALLRRSTRKLSLTAAGERHLAVWRDVIASLDALKADVGGPASGRIVLTAPELFGRNMVLPLLGRLLADHPQVSVRLLLLNRVVNLVAEGIDLAVRLAPLPDSSLTAIKVGEVHTMLCAAPSYCEAAGCPVVPDDLQRHACIGLDATADEERWTFHDPVTRRGRSVRVRPRLSVNSAAAVIDEAMRGRGVVQVRSYQVTEAIEDGRLVALMPDWEGPPVPVHLVFPSTRGGGGALRVLLDHLVPALRQALAAPAPMPADRAASAEASSKP